MRPGDNSTPVTYIAHADGISDGNSCHAMDRECHPCWKMAWHGVGSWSSAFTVLQWRPLFTLAAAASSGGTGCSLIMPSVGHRVPLRKSG